MKKLGIIGGAGPLASALLYETIIRESLKYGDPCPEIFLINYPFTRGLTLAEAQANGGLLQQELNHCIEQLMEQGAEIGILACNTMHRYLIDTDTLPFISIPSLILQKALEKKHHRLQILGTQSTRESALYEHPQIEVSYPSADKQKILDHVINRILDGTFSSKDSGFIEKIISDQEETDGVVLGCSDLPVLHHHFPINSKVPLYDSIKLSAKTIYQTLRGTP
ncbi:MAG: aspartate/glutamate racemase family protein [Chlamydiia bacterium]|nr:aspartate/glutamate racemase family protein [Chlamydiia bacterium]